MNNTRNSIIKNPSAWRSSSEFGVREFRKYGFASEDTKDRLAEQQINRGYSKKKNPLCTECFVQKSTSGSCNC